MAGEISYTGLSDTGFDYDAYLAKLSELRSIPIQQLQNQQTKLLAKKTAILDIKTSLSSFASPLSALQESANYQKNGVSIGDATVASVSVDSDAVEGSFELEVLQKASANSFLLSPAAKVSDVDAAFSQSGTLSVNYKKDGADTTLQVDYTGKSLRQIMEEINQSDDLQATIVNLGTADEPDYRLFVRSEKTGTQNAITGFSDSDGDDATGFTLDSAKTYETQQAKDAKIKLNGIEFISSTNTFSGIIEGVEIEAKELGSTSFTVNKDFSAIKNGLEKIIQTYNSLKDAISSNLAKGQPLQGETTLYSITDILFRKISDTLGKLELVEAVGEGEFATGKLKLNTARLDELLKDKNFDAQQVFGDFARDFEKVVNSYSDNLSLTNQRYDTESRKLDEQIAQKSERLQKELASLRKQYIKLNTYLNEMKGLQNTLQAYIASFNTKQE